MAYVPNELLSRLVGDRLVAVTLVLDCCLQLQFDEAHLDVEFFPEVTYEGRSWTASDLGYADALRRLCSETVVATSERSGDGLRILLASGEIHINPAQDQVHVEVALLRLRGDSELGGPGEWMCWRVGEVTFEHLC